MGSTTKKVIGSFDGYIDMLKVIKVIEKFSIKICSDKCSLRQRSGVDPDH